MSETSAGTLLNESQKLIKEFIGTVDLPKKFILYLNIKLDRRILIDSIDIYIYIINKLIQDNKIKPENLFILFDGFYKNNNINWINYYDNNSKEYLKQIEKYNN